MVEKLGAIVLKQSCVFQKENCLKQGTDGTASEGCFVLFDLRVRHICYMTQCRFTASCGSSEPPALCHVERLHTAYELHSWG